MNNESKENDTIVHETIAATIDEQPCQSVDDETIIYSPTACVNEDIYDEDVPDDALESYTSMLQKKYRPRVELLEGILAYPAVIVLAGAPKAGKSFLAQSIATCVAAGISYGPLSTTQADVIYITFEDEKPDVRERIGRMHGFDDNDHLFVVRASESFGKDFANRVENFCNENPNVHLIIVDTMQWLREPEGKYSYAEDYAFMQHLQIIARKNDIAILLVHHTRKMGTKGDPFERISGTQGIFAGATGSLLMLKEGKLNEGELHYTSRIFPSRLFQMTRNRSTLQWELSERDFVQQERSFPSYIQAVIELIYKNRRWEGYANELADSIADAADVRPNALSNALNAFRNQLLEEHKIVYERKRTNKGAHITLELQATQDNE